jgi:predicted nuclease of restriction endonuclease-like (RecB) superfamily
MNYYTEIKNELINNEINKRVKEYSKNKYELEKYYNVGKLLSDAGKHYGEGVIKRYSIKLTSELGKGYTFTALTRMKKLYVLLEKVATVSQQLSYGHYIELLPYKDINKIEYYIKISEEQNLSIRQLRERIKSKEYERLPEETKNKLIKKEENTITDFIKNPIIIKSNSNNISEKVLQRLILEDMPSFLKELGHGFTFIDNEYKIKIGNTYNYIDLLLFNYEYNCFIVIELKVCELKKEHIGQIQIYMNYIDKNLKRIDQDKTIGLIIVKKDNKYLIEYSSDNRIRSIEYEVKL